MTENSTELKAVTFDSTSLSKTQGAHGESAGLFNYQRWYGKNPLIYKPNYSRACFSHRGRRFLWTTGQRPNVFGAGCDRYIVIRCLGCSTRPVKRLLGDIKGFARNKEVKTTEVYRPLAKSVGEGGQWSRQSVRPSRSLGTVSLSKDEKARIFLDINEYLHPATARWYATRGIPYRRGYLFHGPPGTGKTSMSFALAGVFGLSIYSISLGEAGLTEADLATLFGSLPARCIVLLEDVEYVSLRRGSDDSNTARRTDSGSSSDVDGDQEVPCPVASNDWAKAGVRATSSAVTKGRHARSLISFGGLLNIIDGAASPEGHVLIMTTNRLQMLDSALIRPGRVDMQVKCSLATRSQIIDIYQRMYDIGSGAAPPASFSAAECEEISLDVLPYIRKAAEVPPGEVGELARQFATKLPEDTFSSAEIRGFLLERKSNPKDALREVDEWRDAQLRTTRGGTKVS